jgi:hypothetical protein
MSNVVKFLDVIHNYMSKLQFFKHGSYLLFNILDTTYCDNDKKNKHILGGEQVSLLVLWSKNYSSLSFSSLYALCNWNTVKYIKF